MGDVVHELSISRSIAEVVRRHAEGRAVERVRLDVGQLRQIVPDTLRHCWGLVVEGSDLDGVVLDITEIPAAIECRDCGARRELIEPIFRCADCASTSVAIAGGEEFMITSYDLAGTS